MALIVEQVHAAAEIHDLVVRCQTPFAATTRSTFRTAGSRRPVAGLEHGWLAHFPDAPDAQRFVRTPGFIDAHETRVRHTGIHIRHGTDGPKRFFVRQDLRPR